MRGEFLAVGLALAMVGGVICFMGSVSLPFTDTQAVSVPKSQTSLSESFSVPALSYVSRSTTYPQMDRTLHITFSVSGGDIDFWVMDEADYSKFTAGESYYYYTAVTRTGVTRVDITWIPPYGKEICFVWDNGDSLFTSRTVSANFYWTWTEYENKGTTTYRTLLPASASIFGVLILVGGLLLIGYAFVSKPQLERPPPAPPPLPPSTRVEVPAPFGYCRYCGAIRTNDSNYCEKCGKKIG